MVVTSGNVSETYNTLTIFYLVIKDIVFDYRNKLAILFLSLESWNGTNFNNYHDYTKEIQSQMLAARMQRYKHQQKQKNQAGPS